MTSETCPTEFYILAGSSVHSVSSASSDRCRLARPRLFTSNKERVPIIRSGPEGRKRYGWNVVEEDQELCHIPVSQQPRLCFFTRPGIVLPLHLRQMDLPGPVCEEGLQIGALFFV